MRNRKQNQICSFFFSSELLNKHHKETILWLCDLSLNNHIKETEFVTIYLKESSAIGNPVKQDSN